MNCFHAVLVTDELRRMPVQQLRVERLFSVESEIVRVHHAGVKDPCGPEARYICEVYLVHILVALVSGVVTVVSPIDVSNLR